MKQIGVEFRRVIQRNTLYILRIIHLITLCILLFSSTIIYGQKVEQVRVVKVIGKNQINILFGDSVFTSLLYPDSLEKPVLWPMRTANGLPITRGFPLKPVVGEPVDHPHHIGLWFNFENVNGLDFWNNSYAIPKSKKALYGWIKVNKILEISDGEKGKLSYSATWINQQKEVLLYETTHFIFSGSGGRRIIDRVTKLTANNKVVFTDAKDGLLGLRLCHELQIPITKDEKFTDNKGNITTIKAKTDAIANGNYLSSKGKKGDSVWSTRGEWCKVFGMIKSDSVSISIIDHPRNPNFPTFWHARGYGLFAANPLGEKIFTNGKSEKNLSLLPGESIEFRYRIIITNGRKTPSIADLNQASREFGLK